MPNPSIRLLFGVVSYASCLALSPQLAGAFTSSLHLYSIALIDTVSVTDDHTNVSEDVSVKIKVLRNDLSPVDPWDTSSMQVVREPFSGKVKTDFQNGCLVYTPDPDFYGLDSFYYAVCTLGGVCGQAIVHVRVHPVNDAPVVRDGQDTTWEDAELMIDIMANDNDDLDNDLVDPSSMRIQGIRPPLHGHIEIDKTENKIRYRPNPDYFGNDYFEYSLCDNGFPMPVLCDTAGVRIHIRPMNDPPQLNRDIDTTFKDLLAVVDVLANDFDTIDEQRHLDWSSLQTDDLIEPNHGFTYVDNAVGLIVYVPTLGFTGIDSFQYRVCDKGLAPAMCDSTWVIIHVLDEEIGSQPPRGNLLEPSQEYEIESTVPKKMKNNGLIFPNPATDRLNIVFSSFEKQWESFFLSNGIGQSWKVYPELHGNGYWTLDVYDLKSGIYLLTCVRAEKSTSYLFIKD